MLQRRIEAITRSKYFLVTSIVKVNMMYITVTVVSLYYNSTLYSRHVNGKTILFDE